MNKNAVIAVVAVIVLAVGGFFAYKMSKKTMTAPAAMMQVAPTQTATAGNVRGTIKSLMTAGKSEVCSYINQVNSANITGKIYVADGKMRGDFTVVNTTKNESVNSHMIINDGQNMYAWTDLSARGMKMSLASAASAAPTNSNSPDVNQEVQFSCNGWTPDATMFTVPANVTFYAIAAPQVTGMAAGAGTGGTTATGANPGCAACANLPAAAQAACKSQLNCQ